MPQAEANIVSQNLLVSTSRKEISWCNRFGQASGAGLLRAGAWARAHRGLGPGPQRLGARAFRGLGPGAQSGWGRPKTESARNQFFVILKSLLVGGWRRGGSQLKRLPQMWGPGGKRARDIPPTPRVSRLGTKEEGFHPLKPSNTPPKVGGLPYMIPILTLCYPI